MKNLLFSFLILFSLAMHAQSNFVPGLIIQKSGDTLSGSIDDREWKQNPRVIKYKGTDGVVKDFHPIDIDGFYITASKDWYRGVTLAVDKSSSKETDVVKRINQRGVQVDTVFLRVLVKGRLSLYYLFDEHQRRHYVAEKDGEFKELWVQKKQILSPEAGMVTIDHYKKQLQEYALDCTNRPDASEVDYTERPLTEFVSGYNKCFAEGQIYAADVKRVESAFAIGVGVNYSNLVVEGSGYGSGSYGPSIKPVVGISYEAIMPANRKSFSIYLDLMYRYYSMDDKFKASQLKLTTDFRYRFPVNGTVRPFVGGGITNALAVGSTTPTYESGKFRKYEQGINLDTGASAGRLGGLLRYERTNGFSNSIYANTLFNNWYLCVWFRFN